MLNKKNGKEKYKVLQKIEAQCPSQPFLGGRMGGRKRIDDVGWSGKQEPLTEKDVVRNLVHE